MKEFDFEVDGKTYTITPPTMVQRRMAKTHRNKTFVQCLKDGCLLNRQMLEIAKDAGVWTEEDKAEAALIRKEINDNISILNKGGIELDEAKLIAEDTSKKRNLLLEHNIVMGELLSNTVEGQADQAELDYLMSVCITNQKGKPLCVSVEDFYEKCSDPVVVLGIVKFQLYWYGENSFDDPTEIKFLKDFGFIKSKEKSENVEEVVQAKPFLKDGSPIEVTTA